MRRVESTVGEVRLGDRSCDFDVTVCTEELELTFPVFHNIKHKYILLDCVK